MYSSYDVQQGQDWNGLMTGDPYCDDQCVYRSVELPQASLSDFGLDAGVSGNPLLKEVWEPMFENNLCSDGNLIPRQFAQLPGDFYKDDIPVFRGVDFQCPGLDQLGLKRGVDATGKSYSIFEDSLRDPDSGFSKQVSAAPNFPDSVCPAELPKECQTHTSLFLKNVTAAAPLAHFLHDILTKNYQSSITKVREEKFAITVTVFCEVGPCLAHCTMKVQIFRPSRRSGEEEERGLIVQFRRKKDDIVAFNHLFKKISRELQSHANALQTSCTVPNNLLPNYRESDVLDPVPLPALPIGIETGSDMQPLLNTLVNTAWPAGQVEAMIGFAQLLASASAAVASVIISTLCEKPGIHQQLQQFGASPEFEINYPAKLLISQLKQCSGGNIATML